MKKETLIEELKAAGAEASEASYLADFSFRLIQKPFARTQHTKINNLHLIIEKATKKRGLDWRKTLAALSLVFGGFSAVGVAAFASQKSLPGDLLYPLKRATENVVATVDPSFQNEVPLRRSEEIMQLVEKNKSDNLIKQSLQNYGKAETSDKEVQNRVRENLQEAADKAQGTSRDEIKNFLISVEQTDHPAPRDNSNSEDHHQNKVQTSTDKKETN